MFWAIGVSVISTIARPTRTLWRGPASVGVSDLDRSQDLGDHRSGSVGDNDLVAGRVLTVDLCGGLGLGFVQGGTRGLCTWIWLAHRDLAGRASDRPPVEPCSGNPSPFDFNVLYMEILLQS